MGASICPLLWLAKFYLKSIDLLENDPGPLPNTFFVLFLRDIMYAIVVRVHESIITLSRLNRIISNNQT